MHMNNKTLYEDAIKHWGQELQIGMFHEEIAELIKAINKYRRSHNLLDHLNIIKELADVKVMTEQIQVMFDISDASIDSQYDLKIKKFESMLINSKEVLAHEKEKDRKIPRKIPHPKAGKAIKKRTKI